MPCHAMVEPSFFKFGMSKASLYVDGEIGPVFDIKFDVLNSVTTGTRSASSWEESDAFTDL